SIKELRDMVDFIVVSQHWGVQFQEVPTYNQRARAKALIDAGADLILGHHPHVLQGIEFYNDRPILYSLGNLIFDQYLAPTQRSMLATFVLEKGRPPIPILTPLILKDGVPRKAENEERASLSKHLQRLSSSLDAHFIETAEGVAALPSQPLLKAVTGKANTAILAGEILFFGENPIDFERLPVSPGKKVQSVIRSNDTNFTSFYMIEASTSLPGEKSISSIKVSSCGIVDAFADEQRLGPWKLVLADVNGDGDTELCVGVKKSTRYDRSIKNRIFVFNRDNAVFWPKWLGSDLNMDFVDFDFSAPGADGRQKLLLLGDCGENRMCIAEYNWNGFGFTGPKIIVRGLLPGNTSNWQTLGRGPEDETPLKQ
ncbi:MAG TPA: CapA family protein, partial [Elusimicrobiales bacterium]|nr:CapA family protein [Elusimicrobiales bacterium]